MLDTRDAKNHCVQIRELRKAYKWKSENIVRFLDRLGMTTKQKERFVASELASAYKLGLIHEATGKTMIFEVKSKDGSPTPFDGCAKT